ncbi:hypothetical protein RHIZO_03078 [Rhizobiaceae bacterium]|nr:hypothetical protein RHIZO_03078 [Rhizobiaceae bacterium]
MALALACLWAAATDATANTRVCRQLETELTSASGGGGSAKYKKYDAAVTRQRQQLDIARRQARRAGCGFSFFGGAGECGNLNAQIDKMERNLEALERKRKELAGGVNPRRERARILAALEANGCREARRPPAVVVSRDGGTRSLFDQLFGAQVRQGLPAEETLPPDQDDTKIRRILRPDGRITIAGPPGEFRTLCVRTCDGYFFPMSSASSSMDFDRDQKNCESACPGTEVKLYYHRAEGEESEAMVAAGSDEPYTSLQSAFLYKSADYSRPPQCGCSAVKNFEIVAGNPPVAEPAPEKEESLIPVPSPRPDAGADPETLADAEGGMTAEAVRRVLAPRPETTAAIGKVETGERRVRVVGPVFLPDPEGAIDLQAPARKTAR